MTENSCKKNYVINCLQFIDQKQIDKPTMNEEPLMQRPYYREASIERPGFLAKIFFFWLLPATTFSLRFPEIKNSLIDCGYLKKLYALLHWKLFIKNQAQPKNQQQLQRELPMRDPQFDVGQKQIKYTWIGHSTAVISFGKDANFIIDPVFSKRASPFQFVGPKRFRPPACSVDELPKIDVVLVSHDHYDHLDTEALNRIQKKSESENHKVRFIAGLQSEDVFPKNSQMITLNWTQTKEIEINKKIFKITFVPVCHWGRRWIFDQNKRLWGGFVIQTPSQQKVFYSGDTGYCSIFQQLGNIFGSFDLSILPIGAYKPRPYLRNQHVNPEQAVQVHKELKSKKSVGVHWGTFPLGNEHYTQARRDLKTAKEKHGLGDEQFVTVDHGGSFTIEYHKEEKQKQLMKE